MFQKNSAFHQENELQNQYETNRKVAQSAGPIEHKIAASERFIKIGALAMAAEYMIDNLETDEQETVSNLRDFMKEIHELTIDAN